MTHFDADVQVTFYTDGGASNPTDPDARLASWAVVSDVSRASVQDIQNIFEYMGQSMFCPLLRVVGCGLVSGHQSAARGEFIVFLKALLAAQKYDVSVNVSIVTDASYVCFVDFAFRRPFRHRIKVDHEDAFLSLSYKIVGGSSAPPLHEVPFQVSTSTSLVRSRVGHTLLKLERVVHFSVGCTAVFGEADIRILNQSGDKISWSFRVMYHFLAVSVESVWL